MADYAAQIPGNQLTYTASAALTGGQVVEVTSADTTAATFGNVGPAGATSLAVVGVVARDANSGEKVTVYRGGIQRPIASGSITALAHVKAAANGQVQAATVGTDSQVSILGMALEAGTNGNPVRILWTR